MDKRVLEYMKKQHMTEPGDTVVVGLSGGADSVCLLLMLKNMEQELAIRVKALHVNHGLRAEAGEDEAYAANLCRAYQIPFTAVQADVEGYAREHGLGSEEAGRILRYRALDTAGGDKIAVAHHRDDQAETVLFHLFRGTGLSGLAGIRPVRGKIIRPLLCVERAEIERWLSEKNIAFCMDHTNSEDTYTRNKIRHHILPYAETELCRKSISHVAAAAEICREAEDYIEEQIQEICDRSVAFEADSVSIRLEEIQRQHPFLQKRLLLYVMEQLTPRRRDMEAVHVEAVRELSVGVSGRSVSLPYGLTARKEYDRIVIEKTEGGTKREELVIDREKLEKQGSMELLLPDGRALLLRLIDAGEGRELLQNIPQKKYTKWFDYDKIKKYLAIRGRKSGDYLRICLGGDKPEATKMLKDYFITEKIPRPERERQLLLAEGSHILWVIGHRISEYYKVEKCTARILQAEIKGEQTDDGKSEGTVAGR